MPDQRLAYMSSEECLEKLKKMGIPEPRSLALLKAYGTFFISKWSPTEIARKDEDLKKHPVTACLDAIASELEQDNPLIALAIDQVSDFLEGRTAKGWPKKLKEGRFTTYCKKQGFKGPCKACADKALASDDASVRGMASFYLNTTLRREKTAGGGD